MSRISRRAAVVPCCLVAACLAGCDDPCRLPVESMASIEVRVVDAAGEPVDAQVQMDGEPCAGADGGFHVCGEMLGEGAYTIRATDGDATVEEVVELEAPPGACHPDGAAVTLVL